MATCQHLFRMHDGLPGHYQTLLQVLGPLRNGQPLGINRGLPSVDDLSSALCERGCNMMCLSAASKKRHDVLFHYDERQRDLQGKRKHGDDTNNALDSGPPRKVWLCGFNDCSFTCSTSIRTSSACTRRRNSAREHVDDRLSIIDLKQGLQNNHARTTFSMNVHISICIQYNP